MKIVPLSKKNINEAIALANSIFPDDAQLYDSPFNDYWAYLEPEKNKSYWQNNKLSSLEYFLVVDESTYKITGATGLYAHNDEPKDLVWLGWFYIDPKERGKGLGQLTLEWTVKRAKEKGFKKLRLWTTEDPNETAAQKLYEKLGFKIIKKEKKNDQKYLVLYRERKI